MKIAHFADIHLRPFDRHDEYRKIFQEFFDNAKDYNLDAIVIAGDILHEKTQRITPEVIEMLTWLLSEFAKIADTHIILGNHDGNLKNLYRRDAISPIVNALNNPKIHLYIKSGVYPLGKYFNFCAFSPFDEGGWKDVQPEEGKINICLFHGSVQGCTTDMDYELDGEVEPSFFSNYDFTFLGDIHKHQFLDNEKRIAYPGSTIQQNFGESIKNHGFLLWEIRESCDFDVKHIELKNIKPYVTLRWKNNDVEENNTKISHLLFEAKKYPDESRFRIYSDNKIPQQDKKIIENELKNRKNASLVVYKNEKIRDSIVDSSVNKQLRRDLRDSTVLYGLLQNFLGKNAFTSYQWDLVGKVVSSYAEELSETEEVVRGRTWTPRKIEFDNILQFGEGNVIDFDTCDGIVGIFAPNMSGKSTAIAASMAYALFGRLDREILQNQYHGMVNNRKDKCFAKFYFTVSSKNYMVHRTTERVEKSDGRNGAKSQIWFYSMTDSWEEDEPLHREKPQDTEKAIRSIVGTLEDLKLTSLSNQRNVEAFMKERVTTRKQHLAKFRDLQPLELLYIKANKDWSEKKAVLKTLCPLDWDKEISILEQEHDKLLENIEKYESMLEILRDGLAKAKNKLLKSGGDEAISFEDIEKQKNIVDKLKSNKEKLENQIEEDIEKKYNLQNELNLTIELKNKIDVDKIKAKLEKKIELEKQIFGLKEKLNGAIKTLEQKEKTVKKLEIVPCGDQFPTCRYIKDAHEEKGNIKPQKELIESINEDIQKCEILIVDEDDYLELLKKHASLEKKEISIIKEISSISTDYHKERLESFESKITSEQEKLKKMELNVSDDISVNVLRAKIEKIKNEIKELDNKRIYSATRVGKIENEIENLHSDEIKYEKISNECEIFELLTFAFGKKGIPNQILRMDLPAINAEIKEILEDIEGVDAVEFELEEESDKLDIYVESNDTRIPMELCSGAQLVIASIALRIGLMRISNLPKPDIFILDEPFENLDSNHVDSVIKMIKSLKKWFKKVFLISHMESIKETADVLIDVSVNGKDSFVYHV